MDLNLKQYSTERQWEYLKAIEEHGGLKGAAKALNVDKTTICHARKSVLKKAAKQGYSPDHDMVHQVPDGFLVKGVSTNYDSEGNIRQQWVKSSVDRERQLEIITEVIEGLKAELPKFKPIKPNKVKYNSKLMPFIPFGDPHFGLYCWAEEVGADFDLSIARRDLCAAVDYLVNQAAPSKRCIIADLGDFFHADNLEGRTTRSGHVLDMDTRLPKVVQVGFAAMRQCITSALKRHEIVEIIIAIGNHDDVLSMVMAEFLSHVYENEPRVIVHNSPTSRHYITHGKVLIGVTHGHQTKDTDLPLIMATEQHENWGNTKFRYYYRGHHHHDAKKEYNGCIVEQFRTLAAGDSYAVPHGYLAGRDMKMIIHHSDYGEVGRATCSIDMLRDME